MDFGSILGSKITGKSMPKARWKASALKTAFGSGFEAVEDSKMKSRM
jgi:hypothetical protein